MLDVLRPAVLDGVNVLTAAALQERAPSPFLRACARVGELGARVTELDPALLGDEDALAGHVAGLPCDVLVCGATNLGDELDATWNATRAVANARWVPEGTPGGKIVFVAPTGPIGAALENLSRSLSIEWARYGITITAVVGGKPDEAAELVAFLASPAGDYYTGCAFSLTS